MADQDSLGLSGLVPGLTLEDSLYPPGSRLSTSSLDTVTSSLNTATSSLDTVSPGRARSPLDMEPVQVGRIPVQVVPAMYHRQTSSRMPAYDMNRRPRGLALLIDIERYENDVQEQRIGSNVDVENLSQLLKGLEFDVAIHRNLHLAAFFKVITELRMAELTPLTALQAEVAEVSGILKDNMGKVLERDGKVGELDHRTDALQEASSVFRKDTTSLVRKRRWENWKLTVIIGVVVVVVVVLIIVLAVLLTPS